MAKSQVFEFILKVLNFFLIISGLTIVAFGLYRLLKWKAASDHIISNVIAHRLLLAVSQSDGTSKLSSAWFIFLCIAVGGTLFTISWFGCIGTVIRSPCCLSFYSALMALLVLSELGIGAFIYFDHRWKEIVPTDKTGNLIAICDFVSSHWNIVKWVTLGVVIVEVLASVLALYLQTISRAERDKEDEFNVYPSSLGLGTSRVLSLRTTPLEGTPTAGSQTSASPREGSPAYNSRRPVTPLEGTPAASSQTSASPREGSPSYVLPRPVPREGTPTRNFQTATHRDGTGASAHILPRSPTEGTRSFQSQVTPLGGTPTRNVQKSTIPEGTGIIAHILPRPPSRNIQTPVVGSPTHNFQRSVESTSALPRSSQKSIISPEVTPLRSFRNPAPPREGTAALPRSFQKPAVPPEGISLRSFQKTVPPQEGSATLPRSFLRLVSQQDGTLPRHFQRPASSLQGTFTRNSIPRLLTLHEDTPTDGTSSEIANKLVTKSPPVAKPIGGTSAVVSNKPIAENSREPTAPTGGTLSGVAGPIRENSQEATAPTGGTLAGAASKLVPENHREDTAATGASVSGVASKDTTATGVSGVASKRDQK